MSDIFKTLVKSIGDENLNSLDSGVNSSEFSGTIDTGSYVLNALFSGSIYGGVPDNKIIGLAGESATGKTFFALGIVKKFLEDNPDAAVFYFDSEAAVTKTMMEERGIDSSRIIIGEPDSIQSFRSIAVNVLNKYIEAGKEKPRMMMVLDSLGMLPTQKEIDDITDGKDVRDMTRTQLIRGAFRVLSLKLARAKVPLIVTNHMYDVIGSYVPTKEMSGGGGLKYAASQIVYLSKKKDKDDSKKVVGNFIRCVMHKSRFTRELSEVTVKLSYTSGLDRYYGLLELAEEFQLIKKIATRYELPDGTKVFGKNILMNPKRYFNEEMLNRIEERVPEYFRYGIGNENEEYDEDKESEETKDAQD